MRVTKLSAGCPAPVAPLPPQVSPRSATFSMARSVTFSMAIDTLESRMRDIRTSGSEGRGVETDLWEPD